MSDFKPGLEGVIAFETEIAEPDKEGGALRYRGVDIEELVGHVSYGHVWGLLVDNAFAPGLPPAEPYPIPVHSGDIRVDVQSALAMLAPAWGLRPAPRHQRRAGARGPRPRLGDGAVLRGPGGPRRRAAHGAAAPGGPGRDDHRAVHDPLARRARPAARQGGRRVLDVGGRARHERLHLHRPGDRLDRRRRGRRPVRGGRRDVRPAARRRARARARHDRGGRADRGRRRSTWPPCWTGASG